jgi:uncharacterized protein YbjQ (UPF0145 family)
MKLTTLSIYDEELYEPIGIVSGMSVHSVSFIRQIFTNFTSLFGGKQSQIKEKFMDVRKEAIKQMVENGKNVGAVCIAGVDIDLTELGGEFIVCCATGTALIPKKAKVSKTVQKIDNIITQQSK